MAEAAKAKAKEQLKEEREYYSHILINKPLRFAFTGLFLVVTAIITVIVMRSVLSSSSWLSVILPVLLFGVPVMIYPPIESWVYQPWQARTRKYERHFLD